MSRYSKILNRAHFIVMNDLHSMPKNEIEIRQERGGARVYVGTFTSRKMACLVLGLVEESRQAPRFSFAKAVSQ